jgi:hypothetical protein
MKQRHSSARRTSSSKYRKQAVKAKLDQVEEEPGVQSKSWAVQTFEPDPAIVYTIEAAAQISGIPRRTILVYCKYKLITPLVDPALWGYWFSADTIRELRQIQTVRDTCRDELHSVATILHLLDEINDLRAEIRDLESGAD